MVDVTGCEQPRQIGTVRRYIGDGDFAIETICLEMRRGLFLWQQHEGKETCTEKSLLWLKLVSQIIYVCYA